MQRDKKSSRRELVCMMPWNAQSTGLGPAPPTEANPALRKAGSNKKAVYNSAESGIMSSPSDRVRTNVSSTRLLKPKGIPALHWTTVHSGFGNRDRSGNKSLIRSSRWFPYFSHMGRTPCSYAMTTGLFDPTLKSNQLQADERTWNMQQRRKLRSDKPHSNSSKKENGLAECHAQKQTNSILHEKRTCYTTPAEGIPQRGNRKISLATLLLSRPTFRETLGLVVPQ